MGTGHTDEPKATSRTAIDRLNDNCDFTILFNQNTVWNVFSQTRNTWSMLHDRDVRKTRGWKYCACGGCEIHTYMGRLSPRVTQPRMIRYTNQSPTTVIGSHTTSRPIPNVTTMKAPQRAIQSSPYQNVRICQ